MQTEEVLNKLANMHSTCIQLNFNKIKMKIMKYAKMCSDFSFHGVAMFESFCEPDFDVDV